MPLHIDIVTPKRFVPPMVTHACQGSSAFHKYDWYYEQMLAALSSVQAVFLVPCATSKPIHRSPLQVRVFQKFYARFGEGRDLFVVSEPATLIYYPHLSLHERHFLYDYPCRFHNDETRTLFVKRLKPLLVGKDIAGCLPSHHARVINEVVGKNWKNYWRGNMFDMIKQGSALA